MTPSDRPSQQRSRRWAWHLLWVLPITAAVHFFALFWMTLVWCGVSGCSGGGFGRISDPWLGGVLAGGGLVALVWFAAVAGLPWHRSHRIRLITAAAVGVGLAVVSMLWATSFFIR